MLPGLGIATIPGQRVSPVLLGLFAHGLGRLIFKEK
jgi:hypothetical protein